MGVDVSDINRDGYPDIFVTEMLSQQHSRRARQQKSEELLHGKIHELDYQPQYMRNSMYLNRGDHTNAKVTNLHASEVQEVTADIRGVEVSSVIDASVLTAEEVDAINTFEDPDNVSPESFDDYTLEYNDLTLRLPSKSVIVLRIE